MAKKLADPEHPVVDRFSFSSPLSLEEIRARQEKFASERNWNQYHTPRNLLLAMAGEVGELSELFQWRGEVKPGLPNWLEKDKVHLGEELSDVLIYLIRLSERCHVNLPAAVLRKFKINAQKYPTSVKNADSTDKTADPVATKMESSVDSESTAIAQAAGAFSFSPDLKLEDIRAKQEAFSSERNWVEDDSPRNLILAVVTEMGELTEIFQWRGEVEVGLPGWSQEDKVHLGEELSDVLIMLVRLSDRCHVDLPVAVARKFELNARKYPADKVYGSSLKYTAYKTGRVEGDSDSCDTSNTS